MHAHKTSGALINVLRSFLIIVFVVGMYLVSQTATNGRHHWG